MHEIIAAIIMMNMAIPHLQIDDRAFIAPNERIMGKSSFHGAIEEIPGVFADNFECLSLVEPRAFFLSHCHTDHTQGLRNPTILEVLKRTNAKIYMSAETAAVIEDEIGSNLMEYVEVLPLGTTSITLPENPKKSLELIHFDVSVIPAGHCFGSVMFLFKTNSKTILFTGDFRINRNDVSNLGHFHQKNGEHLGQPIKIDAMYVDTTFLNSKYEYFPKRSDSVDRIIEEMSKWLSKDERRVALHTSAKYGYEFVFNEIYKCLGKKVYVDDARWRLYRKFTKTVIGVTNSENETPIHVCRNRYESYDHKNCISNADQYRYLFIHFSAMKWENLEFDNDSIHKINDTRIDVCFPTHCSASELKYFISYFDCPKIFGFPNEYRSNVDSTVINNNVMKISHRKRRLDSPQKAEVKYEKVDNVLLRKMFDF